MFVCFVIEEIKTKNYKLITGREGNKKPGRGLATNVKSYNMKQVKLIYKDRHLDHKILSSNEHYKYIGHYFSKNKNQTSTKCRLCDVNCTTKVLEIPDITDNDGYKLVMPVCILCKKAMDTLVLEGMKSKFETILSARLLDKVKKPLLFQTEGKNSNLRVFLYSDKEYKKRCGRGPEYDKNAVINLNNPKCTTGLLHLRRQTPPPSPFSSYSSSSDEES